MLDCYTLSLLSLSLTLSLIIIIIIIIIIVSTINAILKEKEKATWWEGGFTNKTMWTCLYACYLHNSFFVCLFVFWSFFCKNFFCFRICNCVCKFDENKNKNLLKKKKWNFSGSALFQVKTRVSLQTIVTDCLWELVFDSNSLQIYSNVFSLTMLVIFLMRFTLF